MSGIVAARGEATIGPGVVVGGKYELRRVLGAGAVGVVYEAVNVELDEKVALKCLLPEMLAEEGMVARFAREAKSAASIKCEYVASVYDVGIHDDGSPFLVMEYLHGKDLDTLLAESGRLEPRLAVEYTLQICEALAVAHAQGIVHRDLKPANLFISERGSGVRIVKVLDFGISKAALTGSIFGEELPVVVTQNLMGTPLYMSPEQVRCSEQVDSRADIWSLGLVLYEMLTGETPFTGAAITEICAAILESEPKPIDLHRTDVPEGLVKVLEKCLQKDPAHRYQTVAELALDLMPFGPKRSRLNVERAIAVLQSAGQLDPSVQVKSEAPASSLEALHLASLVPPSPRVPAISTLPSSGASSSSPVSVNPAAETQPGLDVEVGAPKGRKSRALPIALAVAAAIGLAVAAWFFVGSVSPEPEAPEVTASPEPSPSPEPPPSPEAPPAPSAPPPSETAETAPAREEPSAPAAASAETSAESEPPETAPSAPEKAAPPRRPAPKRVRVAAPRPAAAPASPKPSAPAAPARGTSSEPDLGY